MRLLPSAVHHDWHFYLLIARRPSFPQWNRTHFPYQNQNTYALEIYDDVQADCIQNTLRSRTISSKQQCVLAQSARLIPRLAIHTRYSISRGRRRRARNKSSIFNSARLLSMPTCYFYIFNVHDAHRSKNCDILWDSSDNMAWKQTKQDASTQSHREKTGSTIDYERIKYVSYIEWETILKGTMCKRLGRAREMNENTWNSKFDTDSAGFLHRNNAIYQ